jgi:hypothetical protein
MRFDPVYHRGIVRTVPHIAFEVDNLEVALEGQSSWAVGSPQKGSGGNDLDNGPLWNCWNSRNRSHREESSMRTFILLFLLGISLVSQAALASTRPRLRELGLTVGVFKPGPLNAITDVAGVRVGQTTLAIGDSIRTGVTAIVPHGKNIFQQKVPAAVSVGNGFGKLIGVSQVQELGVIETPIVLTNTLSVWDAANGVVDYMLAPGNEDVRSINPVVGDQRQEPE